MQDFARIGIGIGTNPPVQVHPGQTPTRKGVPLGYLPSRINALPLVDWLSQLHYVVKNWEYKIPFYCIVVYCKCRHCF